MPKSTDPLLSPDDAKAVLQRNVANIVKKAAAGKPLSQREVSIIEQQSGHDALAQAAEAIEFVRSYEELGAIFGPHRASFPRFRRDYPDAPVPKSNNRHSVAAWREFFREHPELLAKSQAASAPAEGSRKAMIEDEQWRKLKIANDQRAELLVLKADIARDLRTLAETQKGIARQKFENEFPAMVEGLSPEQRAQLRKRGKELVDDFAKRMQRLVDKWTV